MKKFTLIVVILFVEILLETGFEVNTKIIPGLSFKNIVLYGCASLIIYYHFSGQLKIRTSKQTKSFHKYYYYLAMWVLLTVCIAPILTTHSYDFVTGLLAYKVQIIDPMLCYFVFFYVTSKEKDTLRILRLLVLIITFFSVLTLIEVSTGLSIFGLDDDSFRPKGPLGEPNQTAALLAFLFPFLATLMLQRDRYFLLYLAGSFVILASIIVSGSRGGLLALAIAGSMWVVTSRKQLKMSGIFSIALLGPLLAFGAFVVLPDYYQDLFIQRIGILTAEDLEVDEASAGRTILWRYGFDLFVQTPIVGLGWAGFKMVLGGATHNTFLDYLINSGIIGLALYLVFLFKLYNLFSQKIIRDRRSSAVMIGIRNGLIGLMAAIFFVNLGKPFMIAWCILGVASAYANKQYINNLTMRYRASQKMNIHRK